MKGLKSVREPRHGVKDFYKAFLRRGRERQRQIPLPILREQKMSMDLYDHLLIQRSLVEPGNSVAWGHLRG
jgi:hypothetical protein